MGGGFFSERIKCLKDTGSWVSEAIHQLEMEVLWGQWLEHGDKQLDGVFILAELLLEEDELVVEDHLAVHVL